MRSQYRALHYSASRGKKNLFSRIVKNRSVLVPFGGVPSALVGHGRFRGLCGLLTYGWSGLSHRQSSYPIRIVFTLVI